jgi:hypothetical protein
VQWSIIERQGARAILPWERRGPSREQRFPQLHPGTFKTSRSQSFGMILSSSEIGSGETERDALKGNSCEANAQISVETERSPIACLSTPEPYDPLKLVA